MARTPGRSSTTLGTTRSTRQYGTRHWRLIGLKGSGGIKSPHYPARRPKADMCSASGDVRFSNARDDYSFVISFIVITPSSRSAVNETLSPGFKMLNICASLTLNGVGAVASLDPTVPLNLILIFLDALSTATTSPFKASCA